MFPRPSDVDIAADISGVWLSIDYRQVVRFRTLREREEYMYSIPYKSWRFCEWFPSKAMLVRPIFDYETYLDHEPDQKELASHRLTCKQRIEEEYPLKRTVTLDGSGPNLVGDRVWKVSFHFIVHTDRVCFGSLKAVAERMNAKQDLPPFDEAVYNNRQNIRTAYSKKPMPYIGCLEGKDGNNYRCLLPEDGVTIDDTMAQSSPEQPFDGFREITGRRKRDRPPPANISAAHRKLFQLSKVRGSITRVKEYYTCVILTIGDSECVYTGIRHHNAKIVVADRRDRGIYVGCLKPDCKKKPSVRVGDLTNSLFGSLFYSWKHAAEAVPQEEARPASRRGSWRRDPGPSVGPPATGGSPARRAETNADAQGPTADDAPGLRENLVSKPDVWG